MNWKKVKVVGPRGLEFGVLYSESGELALTARIPGQDWPFGAAPIEGTVEALSKGNPAYVVTDN